MRYFKPELLARCRSLDDDVAEAASEEWEKAIAAYLKRYNSIRRRLPEAVRRLCSEFSLHDALLLGFAFADQKPSFDILLRLEGSSKEPGKVLELMYRPVPGPAGGVESKNHPQHGKVFVLYDEFDLDEGSGYCAHSLLLSDGREIEIRFTELTFRILDKVQTASELTEGKMEWPLAEVGA